jgi:hypothetical protein
MIFGDIQLHTLNFAKPNNGIKKLPKNTKKNLNNNNITGVLINL